jgi:hypothetical protein
MFENDRLTECVIKFAMTNFGQMSIHPWLIRLQIEDDGDVTIK